jgi:hypothetical protein
METNLEEIFKNYIGKFEELSKNIPKDISSYEFENQFNILHKKFGQLIYQGIVGKVPKFEKRANYHFDKHGRYCFS